MTEDIVRITPYEDQGYFFEVTFTGESGTTVFFVARRDLEQLRNMAQNSEKSGEQFRNELHTLIEHSGLSDKQLPQTLVETFRRNLTRDEEWPTPEDPPD